MPEWYVKDEVEARTRLALKDWAKCKLSGWNVKEAMHPVNPLNKRRKKLSEAQLLQLLQKWASVRASIGASIWASIGDSVGASVGASIGASVRASIGDSVWASIGDSVWASIGDSVWASIGDSVWDSVGDSVRAYIGGQFPNITSWKYAEKLGSDPWRPLLTLWYAGYVPSFDGKTWRLHAGKKAKIVLEWTPEKKG
jgi:hypothetical protein